MLRFKRNPFQIITGQTAQLHAILDLPCREKSTQVMYDGTKAKHVKPTTNKPVRNLLDCDLHEPHAFIIKQQLLGGERQVTRKLLHLINTNS